MTLHEAIKQILLAEGNRGLTANEIADLNKRKQLYRRKKDGELPEAWQIKLRARNYSAIKSQNPMFRIEKSGGRDLIYLIVEESTA